MFRGLVKESVSLIGVVAGFCAASYNCAWLTKLLSDWIANEAYLRILGFFSIFLGIVFIFNVMIPVIKYLLGLDFMRAVDLSLGAGIGMIKAIVVSCILLIIFTTLLPNGTSMVSDSRLLQPLASLSEKLVLLGDKEVKHEFLEKIKHLNNIGNNY
jgi:membrane protein required for colicin V production